RRCIEDNRRMQSVIVNSAAAFDIPAAPLNAPFSPLRFSWRIHPVNSPMKTAGYRRFRTSRTLNHFPSLAIFPADKAIELRLVRALHLLNVPVYFRADAGELGQVPGQHQRAQGTGAVNEV